jgi:hypothetical protein
MSEALYATPAWVIGCVAIAGTLFSTELGYRIGRSTRSAEKSEAALGIVQSAVLGLMAFLLGFAFSYAAGRYETRLDLEQREANALGTAYMRIDLLEPAAQAPMRDLFRRYVDARLALYNVGTVDGEELRLRHQDNDRVQNEIWRTLTAAMRRDTNLRLSLMIGSVNEMFDNGGDVEDNLLRRSPFLVVVLIFGAVFLGGAFVGFGFGRAGERNGVAWAVFCMVTALVIFTVLDLSRPERGIIRNSHAPLVRLQEAWREPAR